MAEGDAVGGVWRENDYPGCACDIPAPLYSFSFALNPHWSRRYPPRSEIQAYLDAVVDRFGLRACLRLRTEVVEAESDGATRTWSVGVRGTRTGETAVLVCDVLVPAVGQLSRPKVPDLPGLDSFSGTWVHGRCPSRTAATARSAERSAGDCRPHCGPAAPAPGC